VDIFQNYWMWAGPTKKVLAALILTFLILYFSIDSDIRGSRQEVTKR